jgi:hypothetical protein
MAKIKSTVKEQVLTSFRVDIKPDTPFYYTNYMAVSHSSMDFTISACRIPSPYTPEQAEISGKGKPVPVEATLQLVMSPGVAAGLVSALTIQLKKYESTLAAMKNNEPN